MAKHKLTTTLLISLSLAAPAHGFEIDSFYQRDRNIKDSTVAANQQVNKKIQTAVAMTKSCNAEELYSNVRNQINADSSGVGIIGGLENWAEKSSEVEKIDPPSADKSIYSNTGFETSLAGLWLRLWGTLKENSTQSVAKAKLAVRKLIAGSSDPLVICKVPDAQKEEAQRMVEFSKRKGPPGGPPGSRGGPQGPGGGREGGPPPGPPPGDMQGGPPPGGGGPGGLGGDSEFSKSEAGQCLRLVLNIKDKGDNITLQSIVKVNGVNIGTDKFGHFFDQGFDLFQKEFTLSKNSLIGKEDGAKKALQYSTGTEEGMFGLKGSGVKSYGDLAANYGGSVFWKDLSLGDNPLVFCENGKFTVKRDFDFKDYVTAAWDEGINCSEYKSDTMTQQVEANLKARNLSCPVEVAKCQGLEKKYSAEVLSHIVSPICRKAMTAASSDSKSQRGAQ